MSFLRRAFARSGIILGDRRRIITSLSWTRWGHGRGATSRHTPLRGSTRTAGRGGRWKPCRSEHRGEPFRGLRSPFPRTFLGFGGSHVSDVNHYVEETVLRHAPSLVVLYAGNNDISAGKTAQQVFADYQAFVAKGEGRLASTDILFISIHPSLQRWERWPEMQEANRLIRELSASNPRLHYADIASAMLGGDGTPVAELFVDDGLHLTRAGYDVWTPIVKEAIAAVRRR